MDAMVTLENFKFMVSARPVCNIKEKSYIYIVLFFCLLVAFCWWAGVL